MSKLDTSTQEHIKAQWISDCALAWCQLGQHDLDDVMDVVMTAHANMGSWSPSMAARALHCAEEGVPGLATN